MWSYDSMAWQVLVSSELLLVWFGSKSTAEGEVRQDLLLLYEMGLGSIRVGVRVRVGLLTSMLPKIAASGLTSWHGSQSSSG